VDVKKLFNGISVIIDDQINNDSTAIYKIKKYIESSNIPVATYDNIPNVDTIPSFANVSFIILDWDFKNESISNEDSDERTSFGYALYDSLEEDLIIFLRSLLTTIFVPIFIFSFLPADEIKEKLRDNGLWDDNHPNRIFIKRKSEITSEYTLFADIESWLRMMPSIYVLKEWEQTISSTKNKFFLDMYNYSPNWSKVIWSILEKDTQDYHDEFGSFITRNLINRIDSFSFDNDMLITDNTIVDNDLAKILEGERYLSYDSHLPNQAYTGDLFKIGEKYYLNIRAQCDMARPSATNPELYLITGRAINVTDINKDTIKLTKDGKLFFNNENNFDLQELKDLCSNEDRLAEINQHFNDYREKLYFRNGDIIGKKSEAIIMCIDGNKILKFRLDICIKKFQQIKSNRIGRILPPHITKIQQNCMQYIFREGIMPTPEEVFSSESNSY
jgi:hypothetical protein